MSKVYVASKTRHAQMWREFRVAGFPVNARWIDQDKIYNSQQMKRLWEMILEDVTQSDALLIYAAEDEDDMLKGAYIEMGMAMAAGVQIFSVGLSKTATFNNSKHVIQCDSLEDAMRKVRQYITRKEPIGCG